jgi:hypothetical protein
MMLTIGAGRSRGGPACGSDFAVKTTHVRTNPVAVAMPAMNIFRADRRADAVDTSAVPDISNSVILCRQIHGVAAIKTQGSNLAFDRRKLSGYTQAQALSAQINDRFFKKNKNNVRQNHVTTPQKLTQALAHE